MANSTAIRLRTVVVDCPDAPSLALFYAELLNGHADLSDPQWCEVQLEDSDVKLAFQQVSSFLRPDWPNGAPQQLHVDLTVLDLGTALARAISLGAIALSDQIEEPECIYVVLADPVGHPFCLCVDR